MSTTTDKPAEGPDRGSMPWVTMVGSALMFFLFVVLVWIMWYMVNKRYQPRDDIAAKIKQRTAQQAEEQAKLNSYSKDEKGYRIPIEEAMKIVVNESKP